MIKVMRLKSDVNLPAKATDGAAGYDLIADSIRVQTHFIEYGTGLAVEIPTGYAGFIFARSSVSKHEGVSLANAVGVIDSDFRGEIKVRFRTDGRAPYKVGDRMAQLVIMPVAEMALEEVISLSNTDRGDGSFGSTGK